MNPIRWAAHRLRTLSGGVSRRALMGGGYVPAAPVLSGTYITPQTALGLTAVFAAINVISRDVAALPLNVYRKSPDGGLVVDDAHPLQEVLGVAPNDEIDSLRFRRDTMGHVLGWGNGYNEIVRDERGRPTDLHMLHPSKTTPKRDDSRRLSYELDNKKVLRPEDVLHFAGLGFDGLVGYSPLTVARQSIGVGVAAEQFGAALFGNGAIPKGVLKTPKRLSEAATNSLRRSWNQVHQGSQSGSQVAILEEGVDWVNTQISPEDAQFLGTRQFQVIEIARLFNLPPHKIGDYTQSHRSNIEESNLDYLQTTLMGWLAMIEAQMNLKLLTRADRRKWVILHDVSALMRGNMTARSNFYQVMRNLGVMSANDIRRRENMNPIPADQGGELYLVQAQYQALDRAGADPEPDPADPAGAPDPARRHNPHHGPDGRFVPPPPASPLRSSLDRQGWVEVTEDPKDTHEQ